MLTELVKKASPATNGSGDSSAPVAIPGSGSSSRPHMEASSWRSAGGGEIFRRGTPDRGTPPIDSFMKKRPQGGNGLHKREDKLESQPGIVVHFTVPVRNPCTEEGVTYAVVQALQEEKVKIAHHFYIPPHQPIQREVDNDSFSFGSFNSHPVTIGTEELRVTVVVHTKTWGEADSGKGVLRQRVFDYAHTVHSLDAPKSSPHSTLVLKNLPFQLKHEALMDEMIRMACRPMYIRYYHDEKGMFKGIAFVKFPTRGEAEKGRFQLDQLAMHGRKVRVEFKHKQAKSDGPARGVSQESTNTVATEGKSPQLNSNTSNGTNTGSAAVPLPEETPDMEADEKVLDQQFRTFLSSEEREMVLPKNMEGAQHLRKLCQRYHVRWDYGRETVVVKKNTSTPSYTSLKVPTPMQRPLWVATPPLGALTGGDRPGKLVLRGSELVHHCKGPLESSHSGFPPGRGKPLPSSPSNTPMKSPSQQPLSAAPTARSPLGVSPTSNGPVST
eukprot:TRINITY_DN24460_c0_g1_i1.p1 TRINITY_DN24460_c0_g1~~TRINITY_DN24460_c0_g1_i1.p1  ORF type:complete len:498 (+),score=75.80 TRINITY_DN24460_c0_g1_i1:220-1713(+)